MNPIIGTTLANVSAGVIRGAIMVPISGTVYGDPGLFSPAAASVRRNTDCLGGIPHKHSPCVPSSSSSTTIPLRLPALQRAHRVHLHAHCHRVLSPQVPILPRRVADSRVNGLCDQGRWSGGANLDVLGPCEPLVNTGSHSPRLPFVPAERRHATSQCGFLYHRSLRWASVKIETHPGSVPQSGFGFSIGTNTWLLTGFAVTEWASFPVGKFSIHSLVSASITPSTGEAVVAVGLVK
jgi:hypothetical protein